MRKSDFEKVKTLGRGGFGEAVLVRDKEKNDVYVLKRVGINSKRDLKLAISEAQLLRSLKHPNIIRYIDHFIEFETDGIINLYLVMEYAKCGDLRSFMRSRRKMLSERVVALLMMQMAVSISHCHRQNIMHRDLKPENIFISSAGILKLGDFGLAREISEETISK